jgi:metal-dependent amidase/aminoacylase/carboxypeptidase family protein
MVDLRRLFHAHPETAFTELWTSATIAAELRRLGYCVRTGPEAIDLSGVPALPDRAEPARAADRATYLVVGASSPVPHHSPEFDIDEASLGIAVDVLERAIRTTAADPE